MLFAFKGESMKDWLTLFSQILGKFNKISSQRLRDFLLTVLILALVAYGFWMLKILEQLVNMVGNYHGLPR
jgi:hypothetical protein